MTPPTNTSVYIPSHALVPVSSLTAPVTDVLDDSAKSAESPGYVSAWADEYDDHNDDHDDHDNHDHDHDHNDDHDGSEHSCSTGCGCDEVEAEAKPVWPPGWINMVFDPRSHKRVAMLNPCSHDSYCTYRNCKFLHFRSLHQNSVEIRLPADGSIPTKPCWHSGEGDHNPWHCGFLHRATDFHGWPQPQQQRQCNFGAKCRHIAGTTPTDVNHCDRFSHPQQRVPQQRVPPPVQQPAPPVQQPAPPVQQPAPPVQQPAPPVHPQQTMLQLFELLQLSLRQKAQQEAAQEAALKAQQEAALKAQVLMTPQQFMQLLSKLSLGTSL